jgi:hypothetical protein
MAIQIVHEEAVKQMAVARAQRRAAASQSDLLRLVEDFDMYSQDCRERIEAFAAGIEAILKSDPRPIDVRMICKLLDEIKDASFETMNRINSEAEDFGANFRDPERANGMPAGHAVAEAPN